MKIKVHSFDKLVKKYADCPNEVPEDLLNENWANKIHGQSLKMLDSRGGLSPGEMIGNIEKLTYTQICALDDGDSIKKLNLYLGKLKTTTA